MTKLFNKTLDGMNYVNDGLEKVRSKKWAEPVGVALAGTATICEGLGNFVPGIGIIGGALKIGSSLLNPDVSLLDLQRSQKK